MNTLKNQFNHFSHFWMDLWHSFNLPLLDPGTSAIAAPGEIDPIERPPVDTIQFLERCWELDCTSEKHG